LRAFAEACERGELGDAHPNLVVQVEMPEALPPLPAAVEVAAFHIGREALTNVVRHAGAQHCQLRLAVKDGEKGYLHLSIEDDGPGLNGSERAGVGLSSMRARAAELGGTCTIETEPGAGTRVTVQLPLGS
jgi:signal transduction histidine kinase